MQRDAILKLESARGGVFVARRIAQQALTSIGGRR